ncbi:MAG: glutamine--fructose-6-phosphate transaminase (isomerizing) [Staphylothermus sp.]|nr:glutamine--fructose-6-phosphate transaminase (isomerizing) [Staphylothermus sp.]
MGGIFCVICRNSIPKGALLKGLKRLLYRGYDGAGYAYIDKEGKLVIKKALGHLEDVAKKIDFINIPSDIVVGHTRYASRGWPVVENTHPLTDCKNKVAVVGDGFIENYEEVKKELISKGHTFSSRTDIEIYAHIIEEAVEHGIENVVPTLIKYSRVLNGTFAIASLVSGVKKFFAIHKGQPLVIGLKQGRDCIYLSSDIPSLYGFADEAIVLNENTVTEISLEEIKVYDIASGQQIPLNQLLRKRVKYPVEVVDKAGYPHYMLKEIMEIPDAIIRTTYSIMEKYLRLASMIIYGAKNVYIIANGTSLHAGYVASYYFAEMAGLNVNVVSSAEFPYYALENVSTGTVLIAISQSGETSDVINSIKLAKQRGAVIVGVTNVVGSRLTLESNVYLPIGAGPEIAVPATKTFVSTLVAMVMLGGYTGLYSGNMSRNEYEELVKNIRNHAEVLRREIPRYSERTKILSEKLYGWKDLYVVGSGINYPIALEGALKLKEASIIHSEGVQLGELRHGPMVLIRKDYPVIVIKPVEEQAVELYNKVAKEIISRQGQLITISQDGQGYGEVINVVSTQRVLSPMTTIIPLQLLAYHLGVRYGHPIDTPPGLAKAITT